jgi:hypothetical protein
LRRNDTHLSGNGAGGPYGDRLRQAAFVLTLAVGIPLVVAWFGLVGWGVVWLAISVL